MYNNDNVRENHSMIDIIKAQICIPVVPSMKRLEKFIESDLTICVLQDIHISLLEHMIKTLHANNKLALVHIDMVHGISSDEHGAEFLCQRLRADGIISSKTRIIETTKKNKKIAIQRMFLIDSKSIERGIETLQKSQPDIVEVMPAIAYNIIPYIISKIDIPLIGGGLLKTKEDVIQGQKAGCVGFTVSDLCLCASIHEK
jgi:glycerol uptake operon antiterminator